MLNFEQAQAEYEKYKDTPRPVWSWRHFSPRCPLDRGKLHTNEARGAIFIGGSTTIKFIRCDTCDYRHTEKETSIYG